jgi:tetratricopeptide (TPR) repeat protein
VADLINKSTALITLNRPGDALACCEHAAELDRANATVWATRGNALHKLKRTEEALSCYEQALQINPSLAVALANKGDCLRDLGRLDEALVCFDRALELHAGYEEWAKKGECLRVCGRFEEALFCCDCALELNPREVKLWTNKGAVLGELGRSAEALQCVEHALELNSQDDMAWYNKAIQLSALNRSAEALACYERAIELNPGFEWAWVNKASVLERLGRSKEALDSCTRAVELDPHDNKAWSTKGRILAKHEKHDEALNCFNHLLELNDNDHEAWFVKAKTLSALQRWEEALYSFDRALAIKPEVRTAREKAVVVGYTELSRSGVRPDDLRKAMQCRKDARVALAAGRRMTLEIERVIRNIVSENAASIANFNERRGEFAKINYDFLLYHAFSLVLWFQDAGKWTEDKRNTVIQCAAEELVWMLQTTTQATRESINDSENKTAGIATALRTVFGNIHNFFGRLGNVKDTKAFEEVTVAVSLNWLIEVYPACASFLGKGKQSELLKGKQGAEGEVLTKLIQTFGKLSLYLPGEMLKTVDVM